MTGEDRGARRRPRAADGARPARRRCWRAARRLAPRVSVGGVVTEIATSHFRVAGLSRFVRMGEIVRLGHAERAGIGEVVRIDDAAITVKPFDARCDAEIGARAYRAESLTLWPDESWKGRVVDALGRPLDDGGALNPGERAMALDAEPPPALKRARVREPIKSGIRVIDLFTPLSAGQRIGIFSGSGVGKSSLLAMLARAPDFDAVVIALVGERGREVREFLDDTLSDNRAQRRRRGLDRRRKPDDAPPRAEDGDDGRRIFSRPRPIGAADHRFRHPLRPCRARRGAGRRRARGGARLCAERVLRAAAAAGARRPGRRRLRRDHRRVLGAGRRRRSQRPRRRQHPRHARRPYRARPRHRRSGPLSRRQRA